MRCRVRSRRGFDDLAACEFLGDCVSLRERRLEQLPAPARDHRAVPIVEHVQLRLYRAFPCRYLEHLPSRRGHRLL